MGERGEVVRVFDCPDDDRPAVAAVAAVRAALGDVLLAPEARHPAAPVAGFHEDLDAIDEHSQGQPILSRTIFLLPSRKTNPSPTFPVPFGSVSFLRSGP